MGEQIQREEELRAVSGGAGGRSFAATAEDFARASGCGMCPLGRRGFRHGICPEEYSRLLMEWSKAGMVAMRCTRRP